MPKNMNSNYANNAKVDCGSDETDLALSGGDIAALWCVHLSQYGVGTKEFPSGLIVPPGKRIHCNALLAGLINMTVYFFFRK